MKILITMLKQTAVYWQKIGDSPNGRPLHAAPVQIRVRWVDENFEFLNEEGRQIIAKAKVYVDRDTPMGGLLQLGTLSNPPPDKPPPASQGTYEIRHFKKTPTLRATQFLREAFL